MVFASGVEKTLGHRLRLREFLNCRERIGRAEEHSKTFAKKWNEFVEDDRYDSDLRIEDDGTGVLSVSTGYDTLPTVFALQLGELFYQLRAALDGAVYAAAIQDSGADPPPNAQQLEFPVCSSPAGFKKARRKIAPLVEPRRRIIESVQPYNMPADLKPEYMIFNFNRALALLNDWARTDRHRMLPVVGSWASRAGPLFSIPPPATLAYCLINNDCLLEHDSEIATFKIDGFVRGMDVKANPNVIIDIAVRDGPGPCADNDTLGNRIRGMLVMVKSVVNGIEESFAQVPGANERRG